MKSKYTDEEMKSRTFGWLIPLEPFYKKESQGPRKYWRCQCVCGNIVERCQSYLIGETKENSCGCKNKYQQKGGIVGSNHPGWKGVGELNGQYFSSIRLRARKLGIDFEISTEEAWEQFERQDKKCNLTGLPLKFEPHRARLAGNIQTASLDRIDSEKGYVPGNIQWLHKDVNRMKNAFDQNYFIEICCMIADKVRAEEDYPTTAA